MFWNTNQFTFSVDFYPLTTYNPVMDNLPCEYIIYVLTAIDNISHALFGWILCLFPQLSKIRIPGGIEYTSFNKFAIGLFRMMSVLKHTPIHDSGRFIHLTTYNPVMDNLPCEYIIYVLTAIDDISHALFGQSFDCFLQSSKICIPCGIKYPSYKQVCFSSFLQDDECFGTQTNSRFQIFIL